MVLAKNQVPTSEEIFYPESDGKPMADNTKQWNWIVYIKEGHEAVYDGQEVFVAGDMFWYPVEGRPDINQAPDTLIALGRPKGHRGSYKQWEEKHIPPQVVFEVWSPSNRQKEMEGKRAFYEQYGVEEYYEFDPDRLKLKGWIRQGGKLEAIPQMQGWVSPLTGVRFELAVGDTDKELKLYQPDGTQFKTYLELIHERREAIEAYIGEQEARKQLEQEWIREQQARKQAELERNEAERRLQELIAKLKAQGVDIPE
jgi:Uma2 family endonuclease